MSQCEILLHSLTSLDTDLRFAGLKKVLARYGCTMDETHGGSSHSTFPKPGKLPITIPGHVKIKKVCVKLVKDVVESEDAK